MTVEHSLAERQATRVEAQVDELVRILASAPEDRWTRRASADDWSAAEICGHIIEMMPHWARTAREVAASPGLSFGRDEQDEGRIAGVTRGAQLSRHDAVEQLRAASAEACQIIRALPDGAWTIQGISLARGPMTVEQLIDGLLAAHLESHVEQVHQAVG